eukprot:TRINITY_DN16854_c2_g1_i1.p1 TRINITY_DN16854_c2_g1~~TRINITY_DN16854_c2_g1_i1.p1  ORF type:complete len:900 (+),score=205.01 TRINITY_DN16854_c2_g1_i1:90-2789(+)
MSGVVCLADATEEGGSPPVKGTVRGGYAFSHPEWKRPWRSRSQQKQADLIAVKELVSESERQKTTALRRQLHATQQELRLRETEQTADVAFLIREKELELKEKDDLIKQQKEESSHRQAALRRQIDALQKAREEDRALKEAEIRSLHKESLKRTEDFSRDAAAQSRYHKQEIESMKEIIEAKEREIVEAEKRYKKETIELIESKDAHAASLLKQLHEVDENWRKALSDQQDRSNELRKQDLQRNAELDATVVSSKDNVSELNRKITSLERKISDADSAHTGWTTRILSQVDTMIASFDTPPPEVTIPQKEKPSSPLGERCWSRMLQLWELVKLKHSEFKDLRIKSEDREIELSNDRRSERERWEDRRRDMLSLERETSALREKQTRLEAAFKEVIDHAGKMENCESRLTSRLKFFIDDLKEGEKFRCQTTSIPPPREGLLPIVYVAGHGIPLWSNKSLFRNSMDILSSIVRTKAHSYGGYETASKGDGYIFLFSSMSDACEFCIETQISLYETQWPEQLLAHTDIKGSDSNWNGIRCKMAIHCGEVKVQDFGMHRERRYHGPGLIYVAALLKKTAPGQIVLGSAAWDLAQQIVDKMPVEVTSLGTHSVFTSTSGNGQDADKLMQMLPSRFSGRRFPPIPHTEQHSVDYQETLCDETSVEVTFFQQLGTDLRRAIELVTSEVEEIGKSVVITTSKLKNMRHQREWKPEDMVSCFATIDEMMLQHDRTRRTIHELSLQQQTLQKEQRALEVALTVNNEGMSSSAEHSREILVIRQKHDEQMHAMQSQCKAEAQRLLSSLMKRDELQNRNMALSAIAGSDDVLGIGNLMNQNNEFAGTSSSSRRNNSASKRNPRRGTAASWARSRTAAVPRTPTRREVTSPIPLLSPSARSKADSFLGMSLP